MARCQRENRGMQLFNLLFTRNKERFLTVFISENLLPKDFINLLTLRLKGPREEY